ncbi:MAG: DUF1684 domain-containing protein [Chloroflexi bacterium]|nr:MAG: DUF1684 domain-containing protein [Chloroflexota bacterium]MBL1195371.1 DUF1684 domain-containing protein [Chloroflexota bacterium]NOH12655.1 DUF1684 domain-containing protein [Chloroflexota bacterium]
MRNSPTYQTLAHYRREVSDLYSELRNSSASPQERWQLWHQKRDALLHEHSQSALSEEQKASFNGLEYFDYDPSLHFVLEIDQKVESQIFEVPLQDDGLMKMQRFGQIRFEIADQPVELSLFWILGYGGGIFLPFRDETNKTGETYGGGRYLLDTIKHADLGEEQGKLVIDFNFAYNPSCAYNPMWHCPLAPKENWLPVPIQAGEKAYPTIAS